MSDEMIFKTARQQVPSQLTEIPTDSAEFAAPVTPLQPGVVKSPAEKLETETVFDRERERIHRQMLSSVSHDLKTPLVSIIGSLEVYLRMQTSLPEEKKSTLIQVALNESYRLDNFINNILDMAKLENGMVKVRRENAELGALVRNSITRLGAQLRGGTMNIKSTSTVELMTDSMLLSRVMGLVFNNAARFGGTPLIVDIDYGIKNEKTGFVRICDNGPGIPETQKETIFSKYTRLIKEDQQNAGTGLGLAISRAIMQLLKGDITVSNRDSNEPNASSISGACFTITFPLQ